MESHRSCVASRPCQGGLAGLDSDRTLTVTKSADPGGTALVPTATSYLSRLSRPGDDGDMGDAPGYIYTQSRSAGAERSLVQIQSPPFWRKTARETGSSKSPAATRGRWGVQDSEAAGMALRRALTSLHVSNLPLCGSITLSRVERRPSRRVSTGTSWKIGFSSWARWRL